MIGMANVKLLSTSYHISLGIDLCDNNFLCLTSYAIRSLGEEAIEIKEFFQHSCRERVIRGNSVEMFWNSPCLQSGRIAPLTVEECNVITGSR